jgi:hypothetical protein
MIKKSIYIILVLLLFAALNGASSTKENSVKDSDSYFPANKKITLVYESSFGDSFTKYSKKGEFTISSSEADKFKYRQTLLINEDGVYVTETYQFLKIFLFINKEATFTYGKPLLLFPFPLQPGMKWEWDGDEYSDGNTNKVKVTGKAIDDEIIITKAGTFDAIKLESVVESSTNTKNTVTEWYAKGTGLIKANIVIEGGGLEGTLRDFLGYGTINFELKEIRNQ